MLALIPLALAQESPALDLSRSVPLVSAESIGMGSAGLAWATGAKGVFAHPSAPAMRPVESRARVTGTMTMTLSTFSQLTGIGAGDLGLPEETWTGGVLSLGGTFVVNNGAGGLVYSTTRYAREQRLVRAQEGHAVGAWSWSDGNVVFGVGYRTAAVDLRTPELDARYSGRGFETGVVMCAAGWSLAVAWRSRMNAALSEEVDGAPSLAVMPPELAIGGGWIGQDPAFGLPARMALDLVVVGAVESGLSVEGLASGYEAPAGFEVKLFALPWFGGRQLPLSTDWAIGGARGYRNVAWFGIGTWRSGVVGPYVGPRE
ncbi:MAG TPA: hypothetical protein QGF58_06675 [Myxococcota bacterium]|nr:hypothetical protein [Myxococcota bacterium]